MRTPWTAFVDRFPWLLSNVCGVKVDPRIAAGPLVLSTTDVVTLVLYLWLGTTLLSRV